MKRLLAVALLMAVGPACMKRLAAKNDASYEARSDAVVAREISLQEAGVGGSGEEGAEDLEESKASGQPR